MHKHKKGFTLIELLVAISIVAIGVAVAVPNMRIVLEKNWIQGASEAITAQLRYARSEAVKRNTTLFISFSDGTGDGGASDWCFGLDETPGCNCAISDAENVNACALSVAGDNVLKTTTSESYSKIKLSQTFANGTTAFNPARGTANPGRIILDSPDGKQVQVQMTTLGRVWICSDDFNGYSEC